MMKFGEALIKEGLITRQQLDLALQRQVQFGGRVGTNLLELRILREDELLKFLSKYFRVPSVGPEMITSISEEAVNAVSRDLVEKYRILPFKLERKRLHAAVLNPKEMKEIDELRFMTTGFDIIPYVITEMRLLYALEKYYGIRRELRFISMTDRFSPEAALADVLSDLYNPELYPAQRIEPTEGRLIWLVDEDAASRLPMELVRRFCEG